MGITTSKFPFLSGNLVCELFMTILTFTFTRVQTKVESEFWESPKAPFYLSYSLFMPIAKGFMTVL